jgi:hypothetical protein
VKKAKPITSEGISSLELTNPHILTGTTANQIRALPKSSKRNKNKREKIKFK